MRFQFPLEAVQRQFEVPKRNRESVPGAGTSPEKTSKTNENIVRDRNALQYAVLRNRPTVEVNKYFIYAIAVGSPNIYYSDKTNSFIKLFFSTH